MMALPHHHSAGALTCSFSVPMASGAGDDLGFRPSSHDKDSRVRLTNCFISSGPLTWAVQGSNRIRDGLAPGTIGTYGCSAKPPASRPRKYSSRTSSGSSPHQGWCSRCVRTSRTCGPSWWRATTEQRQRRGGRSSNRHATPGPRADLIVRPGLARVRSCREAHH